MKVHPAMLMKTKEREFRLMIPDPGREAPEWGGSE
jgi:hypothetical protein